MRVLLLSTAFALSLAGTAGAVVIPASAKLGPLDTSAAVRGYFGTVYQVTANDLGGTTTAPPDVDAVIAGAPPVSATFRLTAEDFATGHFSSADTYTALFTGLPVTTLTGNLSATQLNNNPVELAAIVEVAAPGSYRIDSVADNIFKLVVGGVVVSSFDNSSAVGLLEFTEAGFYSLNARFVDYGIVGRLGLNRVPLDDAPDLAIFASDTVRPVVTEPPPVGVPLPGTLALLAAPALLLLGRRGA